MARTYLSTKLFTTNADYRVGGASSLTQKPLFLAEGHASRNLLPMLWVSADAYYNVEARRVSTASSRTTPPTRSDSAWE